jgi:Fe-S-cluster containining protein
MNFKESDLIDWISKISEENPDIGGFAICPFAKHNTYKIVECSINDIKPLDEEFGVVIFVVEDDLDLAFARKKIEELNQTYSEYMFFDDFRDELSYINGIKTNNGKYNLILYQNHDFLTKIRQKLAKTNYYDYWDDEYLQEILGKQYKMIQKLRNK